MKKTKFLSVIMSVVLACSLLSACATTTNTQTPSSAVTTPTSETEQSNDAFLSQITGTYDELFTVLTQEKYDDLWVEACGKYGPKEDAAANAELLKATYTGTLYGQDAVDEYTAHPERTAFDCYFVKGVNQITISGNTISGTDKDGKEVFSHSYENLGDTLKEGFTVYQSEDKNSDDFSYFAFAPDTPETSSHIEFQYGKNLDDIANFMEGENAYWLAAGILTGSSDEVAQKGIDLFCSSKLPELLGDGTEN
jgi:hypothetical protein